MSFIDDLAKNLGFNNKTPFYPTPTGEPIKQPMISKAVGVSSPFLKTIATSTPVPTIPKSKPKSISNDLISNLQSIVEAPASVGRTIITRPIRTVIKSFEELGGYLGDVNYKPEPYTPQTAWEQALYGKEPIKSYPEQGKDIIQMSKDIQKPVTDSNGQVLFKGIDKRIAVPLAFFGTIGGPLGDLLPGGGEKKQIAESVFRGVFDDIVKAGVKTADNASSFKLLKEAGVADDLAKESAPALTAAKTTEEAKTVLRDTAAKQLQVTEAKTIARIDELKNKQKDIQPGTKIKVTPTPLTADEMDELNFLTKNKSKPQNIIAAERFAEFKETTQKADDIITSIQKAKASGQSFDEWVKGQEIAYRGEGGSNVAQGKALLAEGKHFASDAEYPKGFGKVGEYVLKPNAKVLDLGDSTFAEISQKLGIPEKKYISPKELADTAKQKGYDVVKYAGEYKSTGKPFNHTVDLTGDSFKTRSQLKAEWDKVPTDNIKQVAETKALNEAAGGMKERKYITSAKNSEYVNQSIKGQLAGTYDVKSNSALVDRAMGRVANNVEEAKRFALSEATDESIATGTSLVHHYGDEIVNATTKEAKLASASEAANIINKQAEMLTEAGRTVQAASLIGKQTPEGLLVTTARKIKEYNKAHPTKKIAELTAENVVDILEQGRKIEKMPEGLAKNVATKKLADTLESIIPASMWKKFTNIWKAGLLTGVKTSGVNIMSNFFNGFAENVKNIPATGIDFATALFTGKRTKALNLRGLGQGAEEGVKKGWDYLRTGVSGESGESALEFAKVHYNSKPGKLLGAYAESVYRVLGTEDMPFFYGALRRSLGEQALVTIKNEGKVFANSAERSKFIQDFIDNPPKQALDIADLDAKIATFKNDTELGKIANSIRTASPISEIILPFAKTPSAVATAMFNYSPAGAVHTLYRNFIKGPFNQKDFAEGLGRAVTGTAALWLGSQLYKDGKISLEYPTGEKERAQWEATGKIPNAILIDGKWVPLVSFGPAGSILGIGGYVTKGQEETGSLSGGVISGLTGGVKGLTEQTFLTGVKNLMDAINEPSKKGISFVGGTLASIIPTIISDFNSAFDDYQRKSSGTILGPLKARIPGVRETLPKKLDVWGQPLERNRTELGTALSPVRLSNTIQGKLNTEVERLGMLGEDIRPTKVDSTISGVKLDDAEYYKYQRLYGNIATKALSTLIDNKEYQQLDPENQAKEWKKAVNEIRGAVSDAILPALLSKRYNLPENVDMQAVTELTIDLYKKFPDFAKAPPEKQRKVILKLLKIEEPQSENKPNPTSFLKDIFTTKTAYAAEITQAPVVSNTTFIHQNKPVDINEIKRQVAFRESGISKDPYKTVGKATGDLGKYQVNPTTLAENSQRFLGKKITPEEFLNSPADQEKFFERAMEKFKTSFGVKNLDTALILWHRGFGNISSKRIAKLKQDPEVKQYLANRPPK